MKKIVFVIVLFAFIAKANCQTTEKPVLTKEDYLKKAKTEKIVAWITLGAGVGMIAGGFAIAGGPVGGIGEGGLGAHSHNTNKGVGLCYAGGAVALVSIPIFIWAHKDKKRAASFGLSNSIIDLPFKNNFVVKRQPAITLKIPL
ncbi:MAG: hypothetical protein ABI653_08330 [Bacteroidota bacterium]